MQHKDLGIIDPESMDETTQLVLGTYMINNPADNFLDATRKYDVTLTDDQSGTQTKYLFKLTTNMFRRMRNKNKSGFRFQIIDNANKLGRGGDGYTQPSSGVIEIKEGRAFFKPKQHVIKVFNEKLFADREHEKLLKTHHMHPKPVAHLSSSIHMLTERRQPGINLYELTESDSNKYQPLNTDQLLWISIAVLNAILKQAHQIGLIHCDIKRENIMIDLPNKQVNLIDYCYSDDITQNNITHDSGSSAITSPYELFLNCPNQLRISTTKSDSYAAGKTLAEIWGAEPKANNAAQPGAFYRTLFAYSQKNTEYDYSKLKTGNLTSEHITQLQHVFEQLSRCKPDERMGIEDALQILNKISTERENQHLIKNRA